VKKSPKAYKSPSKVKKSPKAYKSPVKAKKSPKAYKPSSVVYKPPKVSYTSTFAVPQESDCSSKTESISRKYDEIIAGLQGKINDLSESQKSYASTRAELDEYKKQIMMCEEGKANLTKKGLEFRDQLKSCEDSKSALSKRGLDTESKLKACEKKSSGIQSRYDNQRQQLSKRSSTRTARDEKKKNRADADYDVSMLHDMGSEEYGDYSWTDDDAFKFKGRKKSHKKTKRSPRR
jgi:chromosome segregation ATPase